VTITKHEAIDQLYEGLCHLYVTLSNLGWCSSFVPSFFKSLSNRNVTDACPAPNFLQRKTSIVQRDHLS